LPPPLGSGSTRVGTGSPDPPAGSCNWPMLAGKFRRAPGPALRQARCSAASWRAVSSAAVAGEGCVFSLAIARALAICASVVGSAAISRYAAGLFARCYSACKHSTPIDTKSGLLR
jgi:hypothetical protein